MLTLATRLAFTFFAFAVSAIAQTDVRWRYNLHPGDHFVYSYTVHREIRSEDAQTTVEAKFHTHVLITGERGGLISAGFQRNRDSAALLASRIKGKDKLAEERRKFETRMQARPTQFSEAMELTTSGEPRYSWEIVRESPSHLLPDLHEIAVLPPGPVKVGDRWAATDMLGVEFEWIGTEPIHGKNCHHVRGKAIDGSMTISYWWSPESGVIERIALDGSYAVAGGTSHDQAVMELESHARNETVTDWIGKPETRMGALESLLLSPSVPILSDDLTSVLKSGSPPAQRLTLAIAQRRGQLPSAEVLREAGKADPEIQTLATSVLPPAASKTPPGFCPLTAIRKAAPPKTGTLLRAALPEKPGPNIPYFLRIPVTYRGDRPLPLLVYLSGGAGFALDAVNTASDAIAATDYLVLYPQAGDYWWTPGAAQRLHAALRGVFTEFNVDRDRVYIAGFSNGGTGSLYMAELWPDQFAAVVSLMGAGQCMPYVQKSLANLTNLPILFVHGERDERIPSSCSQGTYDALGLLHPRAAPQLRLLPDREHELTLQSDDGLTLAFLKDKIREPFPKRISFRLDDLNFPRQFWVEVLETKSGPAEPRNSLTRRKEAPAVFAAGDVLSAWPRSHHLERETALRRTGERPLRGRGTKSNRSETGFRRPQGVLAALTSPDPPLPRRHRGRTLNKLSRSPPPDFPPKSTRNSYILCATKGGRGKAPPIYGVLPLDPSRIRL
jgi:acetyl esterase/lipase